MTPEQFKSKRKELGMSIKEMADLVGVEPRTIRRYEDGSRVVSGTVVKVLELNDIIKDKV